ncbi:hypothetical protein GGX14DRAFT_446215 [Mycena pura]|uniref:Uncharacterized protein n=1 Tax=Mycena pura TaxID=153505 RepID=A0AAD6VIK2_9AGAR|nr:hypothetical protein GGX14DRAFT_446215 [Mycena pura]
MVAMSTVLPIRGLTIAGAIIVGLTSRAPPTMRVILNFSALYYRKPYSIANRPGVAHAFQQDHEMNPSRQLFQRLQALCWTRFL